MERFEVAIIGGGPAGLSAALVLARACRNVAIIDAGKPRNSASPGVQGFLSQDGTLPADLRTLSREQVARYPGVEFIGKPVRHIRSIRPGRGFNVALQDGETLAAKIVVLAVGMIDKLPDVQGFDNHWGRDAIHCAFCHGFENRGKRWGLLAKDLDDVAMAENLVFWTDTLTVFADRRLHVPEALSDRLAKRNIAVHRGAACQLLASDDGTLRAVAMKDGSEVPCETIVYRPRQRQTEVVVDSGIALSQTGRVWIDDNYQTSIPGMFAAGDLTPGCQDVLSAAHEGAQAAKNALELLL